MPNITYEWQQKATVSLVEYARIMGISKSLAFKLAGEGKVPGMIRIGEKRLVVATAAIVQFLDQVVAGASK